MPGFARDAIVIVFDARAAVWRAARFAKLTIVSAAAFALYAVSAPHLRCSRAASRSSARANARPSSWRTTSTSPPATVSSGA